MITATIVPVGPGDWPWRQFPGPSSFFVFSLAHVSSFNLADIAVSII
jgi:hypothetical protein